MEVLGLGSPSAKNHITDERPHLRELDLGVGSEFVVESPCSPFRTIRRNRTFPRRHPYWLWTTILSHVSTPPLILNRIGVDAEYVTSGKAAVTRVKSALQRHTCYNIALVD